MHINIYYNIHYKKYVVKSCLGKLGIVFFVCGLLRSRSSSKYQVVGFNNVSTK